MIEFFRALLAAGSIALILVALHRSRWSFLAVGALALVVLVALSNK